MGANTTHAPAPVPRPLTNYPSHPNTQLLQTSVTKLLARVLAARLHVTKAYFEICGSPLVGSRERPVACRAESHLARLSARVFFVREVVHAAGLAMLNAGEFRAHVNARVFLQIVGQMGLAWWGQWV